ncbi:hypothetical protein CBR_g19046 [Chara braunii]|uniref:Adenylyltransferase and sulfurtransferase MOCS3 n=1 Tax=Chara braunii TaxID=69332 RepID=A0A388KX55_CHABU|nr:hypothetical protein CBR_g19046 [Chara braunii]|eukprot:GBG74639.1 hypothetical protein CBR_g19046 [Chara braunii]
MNQHCLSTFGLPSDLPTFWQSATDAPLSFRIEQLEVSILEAAKWRKWWNAYVAWSFCLLRVVFHWAESANKDEEDEVPEDEVELLIVQAWRTDTEGELLGILFGKPRDDHLEPITSEVLIFLSQLLGDLPLDIISRCDQRPTPTALTCTLALHLMWSPCTEINGDNCCYPSSGHYLVIDVIDVTFWDPIIRRGEEREEASGEIEEVSEEEEEEDEDNSGPESDDPDYEELEESESGGSESYESASPSEQSKEEDEATVQKRSEKAEGKRGGSTRVNMDDGCSSVKKELEKGEEVEKNGECMPCTELARSLTATGKSGCDKLPCSPNVVVHDEPPGGFGGNTVNDTLFAGERLSDGGLQDGLSSEASGVVIDDGSEELKDDNGQEGRTAENEGGPMYDINWIPGPNGVLNAEKIHRYSRHLLVPGFGVAGQRGLVEGSVLIVGAGGLGSPVALYLAAAGVGRIGIVDHDTVDKSNLHRQIIHKENWVNASKAVSAAEACRAINSTIDVTPYQHAFTAECALDLVRDYSVVVDATDNVGSRYLISDACVIAGKPLVSGAAVSLYGQLTVLNYKGGPCYRCLYPDPPMPVACMRCADAGVLGVVPGIIGCLQSLEVIKVLSGLLEPLSQQHLFFDAPTSKFSIFKMAPPRPDCAACGKDPKVHAGNLHQFDYAAFVKAPLSDTGKPRKQLIPMTQAVSCQDFKKAMLSRRPCVLLDVREPHEFAIAYLPDSINIPYRQLANRIDEVREAMSRASTRTTSSQEVGTVQSGNLGDVDKHVVDGNEEDVPVYVLCRRGNHSQLATILLREKGFLTAFDITGGLESWSKDVDPSFPQY